MRLKTLAASVTLALAFAAMPATAAEEAYTIDKGHTFITFEISHIGYAWIPGTFNEFEGSFRYDPENRANSSAQFTLQTESIDTEHAKRDKHLRSADFFNVSEYPTATFKSTAYEPTGENSAEMTGNLTIKGITKEVTFEVRELGAGEDPWGNFRRSFEATTEISLDDFKIDQYGLGEASSTAEIRVAVEGTRQ